MPTTPSVKKSPSWLWRLISAIHLGRPITAEELANASIELERLLAVQKGAKEVLWAAKEYGCSSGEFIRAMQALTDAFNNNR